MEKLNKVVTLTHEQSTRLITYLLMSTNHRKGEREAWEQLATEMKPDGKPQFPNAKSNAEFWAKMEHDIDEIREIIDNAPLISAE